MTTVKYTDNCDLCGQPVEIEGFSLPSANGTLTFCCAGCQGIYKLIYCSNLTGSNDKVIDQSQITNNSKEDN